jgi:hypothetical protein
MTYQQTIYPSPQRQPHLFPQPARPRPQPEEPPMKKSFNKKRTLSEIPYTARDILMAYTVFVKKYVTTDQIWKLFFRPTGASLKVCQQRLHKLHAYGILRMIEQASVWGEGRKSRLWALDQMGATLIVQERGVDPALINTQPRADEAVNLSIKHILLTTEYQIALQDACQLAGYELEEWLDERESHVSPQQAVPLVGPDGQELRSPIPDAFFVLSRAGKRGMYFLEIDRATEDIALSPYQRSTIAGKVAAYLMWEDCESYRQQCGTRPLRALFVTVGARRLRNMRHAAERVIQQRLAAQSTLAEEDKQVEVIRLGKRFRFLTFEHVQPETLLTQPVWQVAGHETLETMLE